ncbi:MAG: ABC transporter ATP-binding protein [Sphaerochaetaceae bacterium]|jgi:iron complex transport system ATP-binding protein|nr:ABC transporter ATP-binding protein [Sphaerochaetaceae bacterium]MDD3163004.1 ABC transporter ATP-binding protein [Sphaerochaetaceae bacterium]MDD4007264.1 ABC transporter ATP-binding protein [Sphaerochaetaceae bacterium]MDD4396204.1 ABC transporter ATP-binding protein [Sphaerochaetaceae bacterium]
MKAALQIDGLCGGYKDRIIFNGLSLTAEKGKFTALVGPNGSGKSTLFRIILRGLKSSSGHILIDGRDTSGMNQIELAQLAAFVPQYYILPDGFSVKQIISMTDYARRPCSDSDVKSALEMVGITELENRQACELSGGEAQLVMLCRAICCRTSLILMDEPTSNLDIKAQSQLLRTARTLADEGRSIFCAIHDLNSALQYAQFCHVLDHGTLVCSGTPEQAITEDTLRSVFHSDARIFTEPETGRRIVIS